jgi:hypothetical protein
VLDLRVRERELALDLLHRAARARGGQADVVSVHQRGAPIEALASRVAHEAQPHVGLVVDLLHGLAQLIGVAGRDHDLTLFDLQRRERPRRRVVDLSHHLGARRVRTELRLVGRLHGGRRTRTRPRRGDSGPA